MNDVVTQLRRSVAIERQRDRLLDVPGELTRTGWLLPEGLSLDEWLAAGSVLTTLEGRLAWALGDWWCYGEHAYGERMNAVASGAFGELHFQTLANYGWVARRVETSRRREVLSFGHHDAIARLEADAQERWLSRAAEEGWTLKQLRTAVGLDRLNSRHKAIADAAQSKGIKGPFPLIYADPPWRFEVHSEATSNSIPSHHYPTLTYDEISALCIEDVPIQELSTDDCVLWLWCTSANLKSALGVIEAWGFEYKTHAIWDKQQIGNGYILRNQHELLLYGTKGKPPAPIPPLPSSLFSFKRGRHSAKPTEIRDTISRMYPEFVAAQKIELFARGPIEGWTSWGFESSK